MGINLVKGNHKMKKPNVFKRWIYNLLKDTDDYYDNTRMHTIVPDQSSTFDESHSIRLNVYSSGGHLIVESRTYDQQRDRGNYKLHVITKDEDFGQGLSRIITMESLRL
jgi:hypothetical protein